MDLGIAERVAAVTGASRGIGRETARQLAAEGVKVVLVARSEDALAEAARECEEAGGEATALALDVTGPDAGERIVETATQHFGRLDLLVNNAGASRIRTIEEVPDEAWQAAWDLNVMAPMRAMKAAIPPMADRGWGRVVNVASTAGKRPSPSMPEYSVAKSAELCLSRLFADRHAGAGVLVNAVCPGPVESEMWMDEGGLLDQTVEAAGHDSREAALEETGSKRPIGRLATSAEVASAIVFLCSERASYVAGAAWSVDGGTVQVII